MSKRKKKASPKQQRQDTRPQWVRDRDFVTIRRPDGGKVIVERCQVEC